MTSERVNMRHNCVFHGMTLVNTAVYSYFSENHARYSEMVEIPEINLTLLAHYEMQALGEASTRLTFNVNWMGAKLPAENKQGMMAGQVTNLAWSSSNTFARPALPSSQTLVGYVSLRFRPIRSTY